MKKIFLLILALLAFYGLIQLSNPYYVPDEVNQQIIIEEGLE